MMSHPVMEHFRAAADPAILKICDDCWGNRKLLIRWPTDAQLLTPAGSEAPQKRLGIATGMVNSENADFVSFHGEEDFVSESRQLCLANRWCDLGEVLRVLPDSFE